MGTAGSNGNSAGENSANGNSANGNYAVIRSGGKQYTVSPGQSITVNKLAADKGELVVLNEVLLLKAAQGESSKLLVGNPLISGASVKAKVLAQKRGVKVRIFKKKRRKGYTKKQGHRQYLTEVLIESIDAP